MGIKNISKLKTQVIVVGAGAAGINAAIASARNGAETILIERDGFLGGISASLGWIGFHDQDYRQIVKGIPHEIVENLWSRNAASRYELDVKCSSIISVNSHHWKILAMKMATDAGVKVMLQTLFVDTITKNDRICGVIVENKSGRQEIYSDVVIDCSGDGDVADRAGAAWEKGRTKDGLVQAPTLVFKLGGLSREEFIKGCKDPSLNYREWVEPYPEIRDKLYKRLDNMDVIICGGYAPLMEKARNAGEIDLPQTRIVGVKLHKPDEFLVVMTRVLGLDPTNVESMSLAYEKLYAQIPQLLDFFPKYVPGFEKAFLLEIAPAMGVRESRRITGDYTLSTDDVINGNEHNDVIALGGYHVDIHRPSGTWVDSMNVQTYDIPYRSLVVKNKEGLLVAGKCISASHEAIASARVIPICMAEGQAAGTAAAISIKEKKELREININNLKNTLIDQKAELRETLEPIDQNLIDEIGQLPKEKEETDGERDKASSGVQAWIN